jgi:cyclic-di-GMP-binding biofilm dispersal mediator protein
VVRISGLAHSNELTCGTLTIPKSAFYVNWVANDMDKTVLVTGATDGIGLALAQQYVSQNARLVLLGRRAPSALDPALFRPDRYCQVDLSEPGADERVVQWLAEHGILALDLAIHNAGVGYVGPLATQTPASIRSLVDVNFWAPVALSHRLYPWVVAAGGRQVYVSSVAADLPGPRYAVYSATKAALDGFVGNWQRELTALRDPMQTRLVHIGATRTGMHAKSGADPEQLGWERFAAADQVAKEIAAAADGPHPEVTLGWRNRLAQQVGSRTRLMDRFMTHAADAVTPPRLRRHVAITGAADGIGRALALAYAQRGWSITGLDVDAARSAATADEIAAAGAPAHFIVADLANPAAVAEALANLAQGAPIDVFVHSAGINCVGPFQSSAVAAQRKVVEVNLLAPLLLTAGLLRDELLNPGATLVFIASLSHFVGYPGAAVYAATKDGLTSFARSLAVALAPDGVHVTTVFPGPTRTAHARRYSPDNRREARRMDPADLADEIVQAVANQQAHLVPGLGNRLAAIAGRLAPGLMGAVMERTLFQPMLHQATTR